MKRCWIGAGLLAILLAVSLLASWAMERVHAPVVQALWAAENAAQAGNWPLAVKQAEQASRDWFRWEGLRSCLSDHTHMEEVDGKFAVLSACIATDDREELPALAAETAKKVQAMGDAHGLTLGNFF